MEEENTQDISGKFVAIFKNDGIIKHATVLSSDATFLVVRFCDGGEELIPLVSISRIRVLE